MAAIDWPRVKAVFLATGKSQRELAKEFNIRQGSIAARAARDGWAAEREKMQTESAAEILAETQAVRARALQDMNDRDVMASRAVQAKGAEMLKKARTPNELRAVAASFESAQRIGRLALGAETEHSVVTARELPASLDDFL